MKLYKRDLEALRKGVRSFNSKLNRLKKKGVSNDFLPEKLSLVEIKKQLKNEDREAFKIQMEDIKNFTNRTAMHIKKNDTNNKLAVWQIRQMKRNQERDRKISIKQYESVKNIIQSHKELTQKQERQLERINNKIEELNNGKEFDWNGKVWEEIEMLKDYYLNVDKSFEGRMRKYREGYMQSLKKVSTKKEYNKLKKMLSELNDVEIYQAYYQDKDLSTKFNYNEIFKFHTGNIKQVMDKWQTIINAKNDVKEGTNINTRAD